MTVKDRIDKLSPEQKQIALRGLLAESARVYDPDGYGAFYELVYHRRPPKHVRKWIKRLFEAIDEELFALVEAFRGATKSTTFEAFVGWFIGIFPDKSNLLIGSGDNEANKLAGAIADIIAHNEGWKLAFPHIVPDPDKAWGAASGYEVKQTHTDATLAKELPYSDWRTMRQKNGPDPTFIGVGYKSNYIPGPHPTGVLWVDDIHTRDNTVSQRELLRAKEIYTGTLIPTLEPGTVHIFSGTPWSPDDLIMAARNNEAYIHIFTPSRDEEGNPTWPEKWDDDRLEKRRKEVNNPVEYARMYDLDLDKMKGLVLKREWLRYFEAEELMKYGENWKTFIGVDFTSTANPDSDRSDYFALAVCKLAPNGKLIVVDGVYTRYTQADAEQAVLNWATDYPYLVELGIEAILGGNDFWKMVNRGVLAEAGIVATGLKGGPFQKKKGYRYEKIMGPEFQRGRIMLSTQDNKFIRAFEQEWVGWNGDKMADMGHDDALDAVFNAYWMAADHMTTSQKRSAEVSNPLYPKKKKPNPMKAWANG